MDILNKNNETEMKKSRGRQFKRGESGNKVGKRPGTRNKATLASEALLEGARLRLTQKLIDKAEAGDMMAMRLLSPYFLPRCPEPKLIFKLPPLKTAADAISAIARILEGMGQGELSESGARTLEGIVHTFLEAQAHLDFEKGLTELEEIKSAIEEKALEVREQNTSDMPLDFFKVKDGE